MEPIEELSTDNLHSYEDYLSYSMDSLLEVYENYLTFELNCISNMLLAVQQVDKLNISDKQVASAQIVRSDTLSARYGLAHRQRILVALALTERARAYLKVISNGHTLVNSDYSSPNMEALK